MTDDHDHKAIDLELRRAMSRERACEVLGVTLRTLQRRMKSGDVERVEVPGEPDRVRIKLTKWSTDRLAKAQTESPARHVATQDATGDDVSRHVADLATRLDALERQLGERLEHVGHEEAADEEFLKVDHADHAGHGEGGPSGRSERDVDAERVDALSGWRAVCVAVLVRLKLLLDAIISAIRGERG